MCFYVTFGGCTFIERIVHSHFQYCRQMCNSIQIDKVEISAALCSVYGRDAHIGHVSSKMTGPALQNSIPNSDATRGSAKKLCKTI